jgi:hypothetical protein
MSHFQNQQTVTDNTNLPPPLPFGARPTSNNSATSSVIDNISVHGVDNTRANTQSDLHSLPDSSSSKKVTTNSVPPLGIKESAELIRKCDWVDKTLWVSRQLLGGQSVNGFVRTTSTIHRIKRQRIRQTNKGKSSNPNDLGDNTKKRGPDNNADNAADEALKRDIMNPKTAKRMKSELEDGINFCRLMHSAVRSILKEIDPSLPVVGKLGSTGKSKNKKRNVNNDYNHDNKSGIPTAIKANGDPSDSSRRWSLDSQSRSAAPVSPMPRHDTPSTASPGNPNGSTLRKNREKKLPPNTEPPIDLPEFDNFGKRICSKKEHLSRLAECVRYRALKQGDVVAARVSSRNLWILARVLKDYPGPNIPLLDFVRLPDAKREQVFKEKVTIKDFEVYQNDADSTFKVARSLILPLPRSFAEAAEWGQRYKRGSRVYALYPTTTALYTATIIDSTTYARDDDDIMVVRFDGDEPDATGSIPACHVPSRFVTLIPKGITNVPSSTSSGSPMAIATGSVTSSVTSNSKKKKGDISPNNSVPPAPSESDFQIAGNLDELDLDAGLDDFEDMDFDL